MAGSTKIYNTKLEMRNANKLIRVSYFQFHIYQSHFFLLKYQIIPRKTKIITPQRMK
jgi:hypothetical protein